MQAVLPASLYLQAVFLLSGILMFAVGIGNRDFPFAMVGVLFVYAANIVYALRNFRQRLLFLFLHLGMALFLLSRPTVGLLDPTKSWQFTSLETTEFTLLALFVTLLALFVGAAAYDCISSHNDFLRKRDRGINVVKADIAQLDSTAGEPSKRERWMQSMRIASAICLLICLGGSYVEGFLTLSYMDGLKYEDFYLISSSDHIPWVISVFGTICPYMFCSYLATMPKRIPSIAFMALYVGTTIPMLIIGSRSDFVITCLFCMLYFAMRSVADKEEQWIGKKELLFAAICIPAGIFFMGLWNYVRADAVIAPTGFIATIVDAFYKQGVSYTVLGYGYQVNPQIQELGFRFFSVGSFISNITQGFIGQTFLGCEYLGDTNSALLALNGNSYAHTMSYFAHSNYLGGEGYGSSYILELFADFGYMGIAIGSAAISFALSALSMSIGTSWFWGTAALISASRVFHMPRGYAAEWIAFIWTTRFIFAIILLIVAAYLVRTFLMNRTNLFAVGANFEEAGEVTAVVPRQGLCVVESEEIVNVAISRNGESNDKYRNGA